MTKDISKILSKGTPRQRIILLATDIAEKNLGGKGLLTPSEIKTLSDTFKTQNEIALYNKFRKMEPLVRNSIAMLYQYKNAYREQIAFINGYTLYWDSLGEIRELINDILHKIKDKKLRNEILKTAIGKKFLLVEFTESKRDKGFIDLDTTSSKGMDYANLNGFEGLIKAHKSKAEGILVDFKTLLKATRDAIEEVGFNVKPYIEICNKAEEELRKLGGSESVALPKYSKSALKKLFEEKEFPTNMNLLEKDFGKYWVYPEYDEIEIDEKKYKEFLEMQIEV